MATECKLFDLAIFRIRRVVEVVHGHTPFRTSQRKSVTFGKSCQRACLELERTKLVHDLLSRTGGLIALKRHNLALGHGDDDNEANHIHRVHALRQIHRGYEGGLWLNLPDLDTLVPPTSHKSATKDTGPPDTADCIIMLRHDTGLVRI